MLAIANSLIQVWVRVQSVEKWTNCIYSYSLISNKNVLVYWLPVNSSHGQLVTHTHVSSYSQLVTSKHITKTTSTRRDYLHAVRRHPETVLNTDGVITAICVTLMYTADYRSRQQITLLRKARSTRHNAVKHDGQLVTWFYDVTSWPCDELTGSRYTSNSVSIGKLSIRSETKYFHLTFDVAVFVLAILVWPFWTFTVAVLVSFVAVLVRSGYIVWLQSRSPWHREP